jgi:exodeoxyribonuclease-3
MPSTTPRELRLISWNVNGLRATLKKDPSFPEIFTTFNADVFAIQETKLQDEQRAKLKDVQFEGYHQTWNYAERKGYSGTAVWSREEPLQVIRQIGSEVADDEGRICALEFPTYWFVDVYTPNAQDGLRRIETRLAWDARYRDFLRELDADKPVVTCGDFNVAHKEIDLKNPGPNRGNPVFSDEERESFGKLLDAGFVDTFRARHPDLTGAYSWWSYRFNARKNNAGWRIDYFLVSSSIADRVRSASILSEVYGSDHCPVELTIEI